MKQTISYEMLVKFSGN